MLTKTIYTKQGIFIMFLGLLKIMWEAMDKMYAHVASIK
jgi:uncharacterized membrane protein